MKKKFLANILLLVFLNLLIKPLWVFIEIEVQNKVGTQNFGLYFALFNLTQIFNIILDAGIVNFNNKEIAGNPLLIEKYTNRLIPLRALLGLIYLLMILVIGWLFNYDSFAIMMLAGLGVNQILLAFLLYFRSNLQGLHFFKSDSLISVADRLIMAILVLYVLYALKVSEFKIEWFIYIQSAGYLFAALLAAVFLFTHSKIKFKFKFNLAFSLVFLKKCIPYALIGILMLLYYFADSVMLERMLPNGDEAAGIYAQSFRILLALINFSYLFSLLLLPMFSKMIAKKENLTELIQLSGSLLILGAVFVAFSCAAFSNEIISALYGKTEGLGMMQRIILSFHGELPALQNSAEVALSSDIFFFIILNFIPISALYVYGTLLTAAGEMKWLNITAAIGVVINLGANFFLIPVYGPLGSAIISLSTQMIICLLQIGYAKKKFNLNFTWSLFFKYLITMTVFCGTLYVLKQSTVSWPVQITVCIVLGFIAAIATKALPLPGISKLLKSRRS
jgi:O-antigen/teichoic acid export membrane protein